MIRNACALILSLMIPAILFAMVWQSYRYSQLEREIARIEQQQYEIIDENRRLISGISVLSTPERISSVAVEDLGMRKAETKEILRISISRGGLGG
ncbi:MAG TPA: cell division protein FtsL [Treponemataceae bacterium]|jgi:cell division protein FtsL|nr:cell division protein FtsL [Treponemataceae bacterium]HOS34702.1 cell division protein FtsL [Treponemataceae bacterium]HOU38998.1 cell division protein FtsL [Treponemataceae bacterium]HPA10969.1 cell division protein FtsL [Treponemataceae bacterium]HPL91375.1 cell division protein FtsL [Treponemataceae bacterium]